MAKDRYNVTDIPLSEDIRVDIKSVLIPMRDGAKLHAAVYLPPDLEGPAPVLLINSPYSRRSMIEPPNAGALKNRMVYIVLATRGTGWSTGGTFHPSDADIDTQDMDDFFCWLEKQSFFNGCCAMFGASYPGLTQWSAMRSGHDCLKAIAPRVAPIYTCISPIYKDGGVRVSSFHWLITMYYRRTYGYGNVPDFNAMKFLSHLPVKDIDKFVFDKHVPIFQDYIAAIKDPVKHFASCRDNFKKCKIPAFVAGGWFDPGKQQTLDSFQYVKELAATEKARSFSCLTMGPWGHGGLENPDIFGAENNHDDLNSRQNKFLCGLLENPDQDPLAEETMKVKYFMIGENAWYFSQTWPPAGTEEYKLYLHSGGNANTCYGDGVLNEKAPDGAELPDTYISDPNDPVTATESCHSPQACYDRLFMEKKSNMLIYTTEKFTTPLPMAGKFKFRFHASASTVDTDFFATLTMVTPEGKSLYLTRGMIRARHRNTLERSELLTPGKIYPYEIDMGDLALTAMPGYALRLEIHGQEFPIYDRNANSGKEPFTDTELFRSVHTIFHDKDHAAELILPVNRTLAANREQER